ncbi:hypothetical protein Ddye_001375 [Dipteronia dyeriana]|uniref:Uncharacterized protein n=1 Tax=Dipteronia dyeriana TaxID=168575 RepID=A0AAE0CTF8_9ROSI|nr:hypothetical protein Ddye_001375 [Dipteronia dyeriana]
MHGKCLISVVTDGYKAMSKTIRLKLYEFISHIDKAISHLQNNELNDDFDSINEHSVLVTRMLQLEKYVTEVYTRHTLAWVQDEIKSEAKLNIVNCVDDMDTMMYHSRSLLVVIPPGI